MRQLVCGIRSAEIRALLALAKFLDETFQPAACSLQLPFDFAETNGEVFVSRAFEGSGGSTNAVADLVEG